MLAKFYLHLSVVVLVTGPPIGGLANEDRIIISFKVSQRGVESQVGTPIIQIWKTSTSNLEF
jgi:hypothetical protein